MPRKPKTPPVELPAIPAELLEQFGTGRTGVRHAAFDVRDRPRLCENVRPTLLSKNSTLQIAPYWPGGSPGRVK